MDFLLDPNFAYLMLLMGLLLGLMALITPGTGMFELGAFFCLALVGYAVYNRPINLWALIPLMASFFPFVHAMRKPGRERYLILSIVGFVFGSAFLFVSDGWIPQVNFWLALVSSILYAGFIWFVVRKTIQAALTRPTHDLSSLVEQVGEAKTNIHSEGTVQVDGELWSARSDKKIPKGSAVKVIGREGFILIVEKSTN